MKNCFLYSHGGSGNHGCEAIVRGTQKIIDKEDMMVYSLNKEEDKLYGLDKIVKLEDQKVNYNRFSLKRKEHKQEHKEQDKEKGEEI